MQKKTKNSLWRFLKHMFHMSAGEPGGGLFTFLQDLEIWKKYNVNKRVGIIRVICYTEKRRTICWDVF